MNAFPSISSLLQNPAKGGIPLIATQPIKKVADVYGIFFLNPPINLISWANTGWWPTTSSIAWITDPDPKNNIALKQACVIKWKIPAIGAPQPIASII